MTRNKERASTALEYTLVFIMIMAAALAIGIYFERTIMGRWRNTADIFGHGRQCDASKFNAPNLEGFW